MALNFFEYPVEDWDSAPVAVDTPPWEEAPVQVVSPTPEQETVTADKINEPKKRKGRPRKGRDVTLPKKETDTAGVTSGVTSGEPEEVKVVPTPVATPAVEHALGVGKVWNLCGAAYRIIGSNEGLVVFEKVR
jgi:hypothetical protein